MPRLASIAQAGYYPTPDRVTELITKYLGRPEVSKDAQSLLRLLDPCAGKGVAAYHVASYIGADSFGIELDAERAKLADERLTKVVHSDYNSVRATHEAFSILYLNPPYDISDDKDAKRLEFEFLKDTTVWLAPRGILIYIIPQYQLRPNVVRWLTSHYADVQVYRFPDPEYAQFKQIVAFGIKRDKPTRDEESEIRINKQIPIEFGVNLLPILGTKIPSLYIPPTLAKSDKFIFRSSEVSSAEALTEAAKNGAWYGKAWQAWTNPPTQEAFRPMMPLKKGHLAMLIASGMMQNLVLEREITNGHVSTKRVLVKGRTYKIQKKTESIEGDEERATDQFITEIVATDLNSGETTILQDPTALSAFIDEWQNVITEKVMAKYEPLYQFDYTEHAPVFNTLSQHRRLPGRSETGLFEAQKHIASANVKHFHEADSAILVGEMGVGKTTIGSAISACLQEKANPTLILCPPHLVKKWQREIQEIIPNAFAMELRHIRDVDAFFRTIQFLPKETQCFAVVSREMAKLGSGWRPAATSKMVHSRDPFTDKRSDYSVFVCPKCNAMVKDSNGALVFSPAYFKDKARCAECDEPFWQMTHLNGETSNLTPIKTRYPIADYIYRKYRNRFCLFIADEVHELKSQGTDQGYAFGTLARACHKTLALTGTIYGGYASSLFFILHRLFPKFRREYKWHQAQDFVARYGILERVTKYDQSENGVGHYSGRKRSKTYVRELPGISPELAILLLDATCFLSLKDLGFELPPFQEFPNVIVMDSAQRKEYDALDDYMKGELKRRLAYGDKSLLAAYLQSTLGYPNACFRQNDVTDKHGKIIYSAPELTGTFPKEQDLLELAKSEIKEGRNLIVFCRQTGTRDITEHLVEKFKRARIRAEVLPSSVNSSKREEWIAKKVKAGIQVLITNPNLVKTGLDLIAFPTIVFYELDYSIYTMQQAARRSWRLGQIYDVRVFYYIYENTMEHRAMSLIGSKWNAAEMLVGDSVAAALAQETETGGSFLQELAKSVIENAPVQDLQTLFKKSHTVTKDDYLGKHQPPKPKPAAPIHLPISVPTQQLTHGQQLSLF